MWRRLGVVFGLLLWGRPAAADEEPHLSLAVTRGPGTTACIDASELEQAVEKRLGRSVFVPAATAALGIELDLTHASGSWSATLVLRGRGGKELGSRSLETRAPHCSALDDSLALVVALLADSPEAHAESSAPPPAPEPPPASPPRGPAPSLASRPTRIELPPDTFAPREPYRVEVAASGLGALGPLPGAGIGVELGLGVRPPHFVELGVRAALFFVDRAALPASGRGGRFSLALITLEGCPLEHRTGPLRVSGCVQQRVGRMQANGYGFRVSERTSGLYYSLGASVTGIYWLGPAVGLRAAFGAEAPLVRDSYVSLANAGDRRQVFQPSPIVGVVAAGVVLAL